MRGVAASGNGGSEAVRQTGASFYLNWNYEPTAGMPANVEFVPMVYREHPAAIPVSRYLLGMNEPNISSEGYTCPADYVDTWHEIEARWGNRRLGSPGVAWSGNIAPCWRPDGSMIVYPNGVEWLTDFRIFYQRQYGVPPKWDVLSFHCYPPPETQCYYRQATQQIVALADAWGIPEVWVTETDAGKYGSQNVQLLNDEMAYWLSVPEVTRVFYYQDWGYAAPQNSPLTDAAGNLTQYGNAFAESR